AELLVGTVVLVLPYFRPGLFVQTKHALLPFDDRAAESARGVLRTARQHVVGDENVPVCNRRTRVAGPDGRLPQDPGSSGGKPVEDYRSTPDAGTLGSQPLRPIVRPCNAGRRTREKRHVHHRTKNSPHRQVSRDSFRKIAFKAIENEL